MARLRQTLDELDPPAWGEPNYDSHLVTRCYELRRQPIDSMSIEDLRILIGQRVGLRFLLPRALEELEKNPLAEGDFYPGDLLLVTLKAVRSESSQAEGFREQLIAIVSELQIDDEFVARAVKEFRQDAA